MSLLLCKNAHLSNFKTSWSKTYCQILEEKYCKQWNGSGADALRVNISVYNPFEKKSVFMYFTTLHLVIKWDQVGFRFQDSLP